MHNYAFITLTLLTKSGPLFANPKVTAMANSVYYVWCSSYYKRGFMCAYNQTWLRFPIFIGKASCILIDSNIEFYSLRMEYRYE